MHNINSQFNMKLSRSCAKDGNVLARRRTNSSLISSISRVCNQSELRAAAAATAAAAFEQRCYVTKHPRQARITAPEPWPDQAGGGGLTAACSAACSSAPAHSTTRCPAGQPADPAPPWSFQGRGCPLQARCSRARSPWMMCPIFRAVS